MGSALVANAHVSDFHVRRIVTPSNRVFYEIVVRINGEGPYPIRFLSGSNAERDAAAFLPTFATRFNYVEAHANGIAKINVLHEREVEWTDLTDEVKGAVENVVRIKTGNLLE